MELFSESGWHGQFPASQLAMLVRIAGKCPCAQLNRHITGKHAGGTEYTEASVLAPGRETPGCGDQPHDAWPSG